MNIKNDSGGTIDAVDSIFCMSDSDELLLLHDEKNKLVQITQKAGCGRIMWFFRYHT